MLEKHALTACEGSDQSGYEKCIRNQLNHLLNILAIGKVSLLAILLWEPISDPDSFVLKLAMSLRYEID